MLDKEVVQTHLVWALEDTKMRRLEEYANPITGSDRFFAEASRLTALGLTEEAKAASITGEALYNTIKLKYPWPTFTNEK